MPASKKSVEISPGIPIACSLNGEELPQRLDEIARIGKDSLVLVDRDGAMHFRRDPETRQRLEAIIAAESTCCAFLNFEQREEAETLVLSIAAPTGGEQLAADLMNTFAQSAEVR